MGGYESTILGTGVIQVKEVLDTARSKTADTHFIIEQESYQGKTPMDSCKGRSGDHEEMGILGET